MKRIFIILIVLTMGWMMVGMENSLAYDHRYRLCAIVYDLYSKCYNMGFIYRNVNSCFYGASILNNELRRTLLSQGFSYLDVQAVSTNMSNLCYISCLNGVAGVRKMSFSEFRRSSCKLP